jgi:hypothetical protein
VVSSPADLGDPDGFWLVGTDEDEVMMGEDAVVYLRASGAGVRWDRRSCSTRTAV